MSTKGIADVVFCLDSSGSMQPCIDGVRKHIGDFLEGLKSNGQRVWDWRLEFIAHNASEQSPSEILFSHRSLRMSDMDLLTALYGSDVVDKQQFFTTDLAEFRDALAGVPVAGDEAPLVALDFCLDLPWRDAKECHRVVIMMTDEPFEGGAGQDFQRSQLDALRRKIMARKVMLFIVAPQSPVFDELAAVDRCEYEAVQSDGNGLATVDLQKVLAYIGKSVSASTPGQQSPSDTDRGLYRQQHWVARAGSIVGR